MPSRRKQLDLLLRYSRDALVLVDAAGTIRVMNDCASEFLGLNPEIADVSLLDLLSGETRSHIGKALEGSSNSTAVTSIHGELQDGRTVDFWIDPISENGNKPESSSLVTIRPRDALNLKNPIQERFLMLESVGTLAGTIALDLNNLLGAILGHASFVKNRMDSRSPYYDDIKAIESAAVSSSRMVDQLYTFVQPAGEPSTPVDLNAAVRNVAAVMKGAFREKITIALDLTSDLPLIIADDVLVDRILIALLVNAYKSLP